MLDAFALDEVSRALASTGGPLRHLPELKLVRHRLAVHRDGKLGIQAGQVPRDSTCPKLPRGFPDCLYTVLAQTSTSWTMRSESVKVTTQRLWFMFASIGEEKAK